MSVYYGACPSSQSQVLAQFKGDGTSPPVAFNDPTNPPGGWLAAELFTGLVGTPIPGVCAVTSAIGSGAYTPTGQQTICCR